MSNWKSVRLELASTSEFPAGSVGRAYLVRLPLGADDRVDELAFLEEPERAMVRRHWSSEPDEQGTLVKAEDGWFMRCNGSPDRRLDLDGAHVRLGQKLTLRERGELLPLRVAGIR